MTARLFPRAFLAEYDRMMEGETDHVFGSGKCGRCSHRGAFQVDARGCKVWYAA